MIDIQQLIPERLTFIVWDLTYDIAWGWTYIINEQLNQDLETDNVLVYMGDKLLETIDKRIVLRAWDTLHLEYILHVYEEPKQFLLP